MTAPETMTMTCPSEETLAAFIDGRLNGEARRRVVEHMASCGECRTLAVMAASIQVDEIPDSVPAKASRFSSRAVLATAAVLAAAAVLLVVFGPALRERFRGNSEITRLVDASALIDKRPVDGWLTGFPYKPKAVTYRGGGDDETMSAPDALMNVAVSQVIAETTGKRTVEDLHAAGLAQLFDKKPDAAVRSLENAVRLSANTDDLHAAMSTSRDASLLSDLSAAYYARGTALEASADKTAALDAAERAWKLARTPAIAWNRAVARSDYAGGVRAWDDFMSINRDPQWAAEAEQRKKELTPVSPHARWHEVEPQIVQWAANVRDGRLSNAVRDFPAQARAYFEDEAVIRWANRATDTPALQTLTRVAAAIAEETRERFPLDAAAAIERACRGATCEDAAATHLAFVSAQRAISRQDYTHAMSAMESVSRRFAKLGSPYEFAARFERFKCAILTNDYSTAHNGARALLDDVRDRGYRTLEARTHWMIGLCELQALHPEEALEHYRIAERLFGEADDEANLASIHVRIADALEFAGEPDEAAASRLKAMKSMRAVDEKKDFGLMLYEAGQSAMTRGWPDAADALLLEAVDFARENGRPDLGAMAAFWRATNFSREGDFASAADQVRLAREFSGGIADRNVRERIHASAGAILGRTSLEVQPYQALTEAIDFFERTATRTWLPQLLYQRAMISERQGDSPAAERDLQRAIIVAEDVTAGGQPLDGFAADVRDLHRNLIGLFLAQRRNDEALEVAERARLLGRVPMSRRREVTSWTASLDPSTHVVVFEVQPSAVVIWLVTQQGIRTFTSPVSADSFGRAVEAIGGGDPPAASMASLYDVLIRPWVREGEREGDLVFSPPAGFESIPFAALYDRIGGRYVIDDFTVSTTPSLTEFSSASRSAMPHGKTLIVADAAYRSMERLPAAAIEAAKIRDLYDDVTVLKAHDATAARFVSELDHAAILHFAGHARINERVPRLSALILAGDQGDEDTRVYVHELMARRLAPALVVLSACSTAQTRAGDARGNITIARAFLDGGARVVVATLRRVPDDAAAAFSIRFHEALRAGASPAAAVRTAQLHVRARPRSGAAWAAFCVLQGAA